MTLCGNDWCDNNVNGDCTSSETIPGDCPEYIEETEIKQIPIREE